MFEGLRVLITGGTGSLGKVLVRRILSGEMGTPEKVIVLSRDEAKQHDMRVSYLHKQVTTDEVIYDNYRRKLEFRIGDVRNYSDVCSAMWDSDIVINAAALKQVPTCEYFPFQAVMTNCVGAQNIVRAITEARIPIKTIVGISTDKACKPVNVMGMTKSIQERIFISSNIVSDTRAICVRYGNVMASRGSVIPLFHQQIQSGGPVTITAPNMTRFLLTIDQAVDTVFAALKEASPGEIYVPNAPAATVSNIAKVLVENTAVEMTITGVRPGEKMHEIMISEQEIHHAVKRGEYFSILPMLPELLDSSIKIEQAFSTEFSSEDSVLDISGTRVLLQKHDLLIGAENLSEGGELLR